jgi:molybdopterin-guanine dinucleotide biosynthesis protein A
MNIPCAGIILSGGLNARMGGRNKAFLHLDGKPFLGRIYDTLPTSFIECLLVTREPGLYSKWNLKIVEDILSVRSPLTGIHAGLVNTKAEYAFCTSCDTPLLKKETIRVLINAIESGDDVIVPASGSYFQPLCAVYSKRCVPFIEEQLHQGDLKADHLFDKIKLKKIPYERFEAFDPGLNSFFNVNTMEDLHRANQLIDSEKNAPAKLNT